MKYLSLNFRVCQIHCSIRTCSWISSNIFLFLRAWNAPKHRLLKQLFIYFFLLTGTFYGRATSCIYSCRQTPDPCKAPILHKLDKTLASSPGVTPKNCLHLRESNLRTDGNVIITKTFTTWASPFGLPKQFLWKKCMGAQLHMKFFFISNITVPCPIFFLVSFTIQALCIDTNTRRGLCSLFFFKNLRGSCFV